MDVTFNFLSWSTFIPCFNYDHSFRHLNLSSQRPKFLHSRNHLSFYSYSQVSRCAGNYMWCRIYSQGTGGRESKCKTPSRELQTKGNFKWITGVCFGWILLGMKCFSHLHCSYIKLFILQVFLFIVLMLPTPCISRLLHVFFGNIYCKFIHTARSYAFQIHIYCKVMCISTPYILQVCNLHFRKLKFRLLCSRI